VKDDKQMSQSLTVHLVPLSSCRTADNLVAAPAEAGQKEIFSSWALFILIMLLILALFTSYILQAKKIQAVHETVISIIAGMNATGSHLSITRLTEVQEWLLVLLFEHLQEVLYRTASASIISSSSIYYSHLSSLHPVTSCTR
jgi:hypothetical protein